MRAVLSSSARAAPRSLPMSQLCGALASAEWSEGTGELQCFGVGAMNMVRFCVMLVRRSSEC
jgi:stage V sporulation protein SpoVS